MQVEHLTLGGNTAIRDTDGIAEETIAFLKDFQIKEGIKTIPFPTTSFSVKMTATETGAMFDFMRGADIAYMNVCCFEEKYTNELLESINGLKPIISLLGKPRLPVLSQWIYTVPIAPFLLSMQDQMIAGEVELYIYYSLLLARE